MVRYHTHHHHPVGDVLKRELKAYTDELKAVSGDQAEHRYRKICREDLCRRLQLLSAIAVETSRAGRRRSGFDWLKSCLVFGLVAAAAWLSLRRCHACGGRISATVARHTGVGIAAFVVAASRCSVRCGAGFLRPAGPALRARAMAGCAWLFLTVWELATAKFGWLPRPFFPPRKRCSRSTPTTAKLLDSVFASVKLQPAAISSARPSASYGVSIGWSRGIGYWVHPVLRFIGPLPATAWLPIAFFTFPSSWSASTFLIALATGFPVTVLTWSGVAGVNNAYYDVARTLGAKPAFLVLKVAIPAAMPSVFVGLFMGLGASFAVWWWPR